MYPKDTNYVGESRNDHPWLFEPGFNRAIKVRATDERITSPPRAVRIGEVDGQVESPRELFVIGKLFAVVERGRASQFAVVVA